MIVTREFHNVECDHCGQLLDEETWWDDKNDLSGILDECGWKELGNKHYCDNCWERDDDDNIVTKDGRKYDDDGNRVDKKWFDGLSDEEKKKFAEEHPDFVTIEKEG